jgi:hypothetical protein
MLENNIVYPFTEHGRSSSILQTLAISNPNFDYSWICLVWIINQSKATEDLQDAFDYSTLFACFQLHQKLNCMTDKRIEVSKFKIVGRERSNLFISVVQALKEIHEHVLIRNIEMHQIKGVLCTAWAETDCRRLNYRRSCIRWQEGRPLRWPPLWPS